MKADSLQQKIDRIDRRIDGMKNPQGWRDLPMLTALEDLADLVRQLAGLTERPANAKHTTISAGVASDDLGRSRSQGERRKARKGTQPRPKLRKDPVNAGE